MRSKGRARGRSNEGAAARAGLAIIDLRGASLSGLIDEHRLVVPPVGLGRGLPLFASAKAPIPLRHVSTTALAGGAVAHVYRPA